MPVILERLSIVFTANMNLYHVTKFPLNLSFTVHYNYSKISRFRPGLCIRAVLNCFYLLISHVENFSTPVPRLLFAIKVMLNLSFVSLMLTFQVLYFRELCHKVREKFQPWQPPPNCEKLLNIWKKSINNTANTKGGTNWQTWRRLKRIEIVFLKTC